MQYWLMKSEPETFSIDDLKSAPNQTTSWEGVRNYQARNYMRDNMKKGDLVFFYHSNCKIPGIAGIAEIVKESHPDYTALNPESDYFDPKATKDSPRWYMVDIKFKQQFKSIIPLELLRTIPELNNLALVRPGNRLSVMPVSEKEWKIICQIIDQ